MIGTMKFRWRTVWLSAALVVLLTSAAGLLFPSGIQALSTLFLNITPMSGFTNGDCLVVTAAKLGQQACSSGGSIAHTTNALVGDGGGNANAAAGTGTNCLLVNGGSGACGGGSSFTPVVILHTVGNRDSGTVGGVVLTGFASGNVVLIYCDGEGVTATEPTISDTASTVYTKAGSGLIGGLNNMSAFVGLLAGPAPTVTCAWPSGANFTGLTAMEFPVSLVQGVIDSTASGRSLSSGANPASTLLLTTTASDVVVSALAGNGSQDFGFCPPSMIAGGRTATQDSLSACFGAFPQAVNGLPVAFTFVSDGTNAIQTVALKHQ